MAKDKKDDDKKGKKQCVKCGKWVLKGEGVSLLRGMSFACKSCYEKEKKKQKESKSEACEFC